MTGALEMGREKLLRDVREGNLAVRVVAVNGACQAEATSYLSHDKPHATFKNRGNCVTIIIPVAEQMHALKLINSPMTRILLFLVFSFRCLGLGYEMQNSF
jgi:hypothetical protein